MKNQNNIMIISIQSYYARQIFNGTKIYEFRKSPLKECDLNRKIYVYSAKDDKAIIGSIKVSKILSGDLNYILSATGYDKRKDRHEIETYFASVNKCYALELYDVQKLEKTIPLKDLRKLDPNIVFPQYFGYISDKSPIYKMISNLK